MSHTKYDWVACSINMLKSLEGGFQNLVEAAGLDKAFDIKFIDLSNLDLRGQDFKGCNLQYAIWTCALVDGADFRGAQIDEECLATAIGWENAVLDKRIFENTKASKYALMQEELIAFGKENGIAVIEQILSSSEHIENLTGKAQKSLIDFQQRYRSVASESFKSLIRLLSSADLRFLHESLIELIYLPEGYKDEDYITSLCDVVVGLKSSREHTFYESNAQIALKRRFDAFYGEINLAIEIKERVGLNDNDILLSEWLQAIDITPIVLYKDLFARDEMGTLLRDREADGRYIYETVTSQLSSEKLLELIEKANLQ